MPVTFPSHAAAVLPLFRRAPRLPPLALVIGSAVPDLSYALNFGGEIAHRPIGLIDFCVPVGLFFLVWAELLVLPTLRPALPTVFGIELGRFFQTRGLPRDRAEWFWAGIAVLIGATTHQVWDGFTHRDQWPGWVLYYDVVAFEILGWPLYLANLLQYVTSAIGAGIMGIWALLQYPKLARCQPGSIRRLLLIGAAMVCGMAAALWRRRWAFLGANFTGVIWQGFWICVAGALVGLTAACFALKLRVQPRPLST